MPGSYGGLVGLTGALVGADDEPSPDQGYLAGALAFFGCSDLNP